MRPVLTFIVGAVVLTSTVRADTVFRVGIIGPFDMGGRVSYISQPYQNGINLATDEITGEWASTQLRLQVETVSESATPESARVKTQELLTRRVQVVLGSVNTSSTLEVAKECVKAKLPLLVPISTGTGITSDGKGWVFRVSFSDRHMLTKLVKHLSATGRGRVAFLHSDDVYGNGAARDLDEIIKSPAGKGISVVYQSKLEIGRSNFTTKIAQIKKANPDVIGLVSLTPEVASFVKQARQHLNTLFFVITANSTKYYIDQAGAASEGTLGVTSYDPRNAKTETRAQS